MFNCLILIWVIKMDNASTTETQKQRSMNVIKINLAVGELGELRQEVSKCIFPDSSVDAQELRNSMYKKFIDATEQEIIGDIGPIEKYIATEIEKYTPKEFVAYDENLVKGYGCFQGYVLGQTPCYVVFKLTSNLLVEVLQSSLEEWNDAERKYGIAVLYCKL